MGCFLKVLPCFRSHYSCGKSILTLEKAGKSLENGPDSIIDLAKKEGMKSVFLVEDNLSGILEASTNLKSEGIKLNFGLRLTMVSDFTLKDEDSLGKEHKIVIFAKNNAGYKRLIKIWSEAATTGFYYQSRYDFNALKKFWDNKDLLLAIPFYDSFLFQNTMTFANCVPDFSYTKPIFFLENNRLPFDYLIRKAVEYYVKDTDFQTQEAQSIYYAKIEDFKAYMAFRCIKNKTSLSQPELDHFHSDTFSLEEWKRKNSL